MGRVFETRQYFRSLARFLAMVLVVLLSEIAWAHPQDVFSPQPKPQTVARAQIDERDLEANGIRAVKGKHVTLFTDVRDRADLDELAQVFDLAVPQWNEFFGVDPRKSEAWHQDASIILDRNRFVRAGLFPADVPDFLAGFQRGSQIWVYVQQGDYYTRHLLLHEGTHGFMSQFLGGVGAPWYFEGMAELIGLNRWSEGKLAIAHRVTSRDEVPYWGRVALLREAVERGESKSLEDVFVIPGSAFRQVESYAWAWAACEFLSHHPRSAEAFADLIHHCPDEPATFNRRLTEPLRQAWPELEFEWQQFLQEVDYGYDVERAALDNSRIAAGSAPLDFEVFSDRGWQGTPILVQKGKPLTISATGEFQIAFDSEAWPCQANGVTIEYYRGLPLGRLIAAVLPTVANSYQYRSELRVIDVGEKSEIRPELDGRLLLRINDSPARWRDNKGTVQVRIE